MPIIMRDIALGDIARYRDCVDAVAREQSFLAFTQVPPLDWFEAQVKASIASDGVHVLAHDTEDVIAWAQVLRGQGNLVAHRGDLVMGVRPAYRGRGVGRRLLAACMESAAAKGIDLIELEVRIDNHHALRMYRSAGFNAVATIRDAMRVGGASYDAFRMSRSLLAREPVSQ